MIKNNYIIVSIFPEVSSFIPLILLGMENFVVFCDKLNFLLENITGKKQY